MKTHPIEMALAIVLVVAAATGHLLLVLAALLLPPRPPVRPPAPPAASPLISHLEGLTCAQLRAAAGTRRRLRKAELVALVAAMPI